jgi:serine/threonine-protein kinase
VNRVDERLEQLASDVLDGRPVDWTDAESTATLDKLHLIGCLKVIAAVADVHRPPDCWGHLHLLQRIGSGTFGDVYRAWDSRLDRDVALKLVTARPQSTDRDPSSIIHEGRLLARVCHPNVVTIHGAERIGDRIGLWMELVRGRTLEEMLADQTRFTPIEVIRIGLALCSALEAVHASGLIHRDIKAHNVMLADGGRVVLMDFGAGRELTDGSATDVTGTPLYAAPEVLAGHPATVQSDLYGLGVLLFHLLTGSYPVHGRALHEIRAAHDANRRSRLRDARPDVGRALDRAIESAIDSSAERRYPSAPAFAAALRSARVSGRRRWVMAGTIAAAAVAVGVSLVSTGRNADSDDSVPALAAAENGAPLTGGERSLRSRILGPIRGAPGSDVRPLIVVLPFRNLGTEPGSDLLVDSLTAGLIQQLGLIDGLKVTFQQSSFSLRDKRLDPAGVARQLPANLVVEGDVQISAGRLVIRAALLPGLGGHPIWTDTLNREVGSAGDLTEVLTEIARTIVNKFRLKLGPMQRRYDTDIETYVTYLRSRALRDMRLSRAREAIPLFEQVIRRDPSFAPAYAALAATYGDLTMSWPNPDGFALAPREAMARMGPLTERALEIDPMLAEAHVAKAYMHALALRWADAEGSFRHAIKLDPTITAVYGDFVLSTLEPWGRLDESIATLQAALETDPLSLDLRNVLSRIQLSAGQFDAALANCQRVVAEDPDFPFAEEYCARALAAKGRTEEALTLFNKRPQYNEHGIGYIYAITGRRAEAEMLAARNAHLPNRQALIYAGLGDKDRAFEALERLAVQNPRRAGAYLSYPELRSLRNDPRIHTLRRKLGFD